MTITLLIITFLGLNTPTPYSAWLECRSFYGVQQVEIVQFLKTKNKQLCTESQRNTKTKHAEIA